MLQPVPLSRGFHPGLFCFTPPGWFSDHSRVLTPGFSVQPLSGLMLQPVPLSRGFHPGLFCFTPPGWFSGHSRGSDPGLFCSTPFRVDASACPSIPGFSPRAFLFHPSGVAFRSLPRRFGSNLRWRPWKGRIEEPRVQTLGRMECFSRFNPEGVEQRRSTQSLGVDIGGDPDPDTIPDGL